MPIESALVAIIPEAEALVSSFRERFDPAAAAGVPAHITIIYPFKSPSDLTAEVMLQLEQLFASTPSFELRFVRAKRFPSVLYLAPEPDEALRRLTNMLIESFPEAPPYGGAFADTIPHLTIAHASDSQTLDRIGQDFARQTKGKLPIRSAVQEIVLMDNESGRWQIRHRFALAMD